MHKVRAFVWYWLPVILWMALIFTGSSDSASFTHSSRIIRPLVLLLFPGMTEEAVEGIVTALRKCAHLTEYALFALLVWRAWRKPVRHDQRPWRWQEAAIALSFAVLYAATDEYHQTFVPSREGCVRDVLIDSVGAVAGLSLLWFSGRLRRRW
jgi:VanZ family protein